MGLPNSGSNALSGPFGEGSGLPKFPTLPGKGPFNPFGQ
jgi:hypothetical protein